MDHNRNYSFQGRTQYIDHEHIDYIYSDSFDMSMDKLSLEHQELEHLALSDHYIFYMDQWKDCNHSFLGRNEYIDIQTDQHIYYIDQSSKELQSLDHLVLAYQELDQPMDQLMYKNSKNWLFY